MKKNRLSLGVPGMLLLWMVLLPGCRESLSPFPYAGGLREGGRRLGSEMSVVPTESAVRTKSSFTGDAAAVSNWTLLQFDAATGLLEAVYYQPSGADLTKIRVVTDRAYDWYALANVGDVRGQFQVGTTPETSLDAWYATGIDMTAASGLPMSWKGTSISFSKSDLASGRKLDVAMTRLVARYDITLDRSALTRYSFTATGVTIEGPACVRAFANSRGTDVATTTDRATPSDVNRLNSGDAVTFYAAENLYGDRAIADIDSKKPKNLNDNDHPTYIEIAGKATVLDGSGLTFGTTYRFYLGKNATTNFDVLRNTENTVTLQLTDAKIAAGLAEQDLIAGGGVPDDPLWKVEIDPYSDTRSLRFQHGIASGSSGIRLASGTCTAEGIVKDPAGMQYQFRLDQGLYDAGVRVYLDEACSASVMPDSGYAEGTWVDVTGSPATLYFYLPPGVSEIAGQAHVRTLDGRKSDDLAMMAGRVLDHLELEFGSLSSGTNMGSWNGVRYRSDVDTILIQILQGVKVAGYGAGFALRAFAVYTDGTETPLNSDGTTAPCYSWTTDPSTAYASTVGYGVTMSYSAGDRYFYNNIGRTAAYRLVRTQHSGTGKVKISYTENGLTKEICFTTKVHCGILQADPSSTSSSRLDVPMTGSRNIRYSWVDNNGKGGQDGQGRVDITDLVASHLSVTEGGAYLRYDGLTGGEVRFSGKGVAGQAKAAVGDNGYICFADILTRFGDIPDKGRNASFPTTNGLGASGTNVSSYGNFDTFRYSYFNVTDNRVLDRLEITPSSIYVPGLATGTSNTKRFKLYAYFNDGSVEDITTDSSVTWTLNGSPLGDYRAWAHKYQSGAAFWAAGFTGMSASSALTTSGEYKEARFVRFQLSGEYDYYYNYASAPVVPAVYFTAAYTFNTVTRTASVSSTLEDTRTPVSVRLQVKNPSTNEWQETGLDVNLGSDQVYRLQVGYDSGADEYVSDGFLLASSNTDVVTVGGMVTHAQAVGSANISASYKGVPSSNAIKLTVLDHNYTYELLVSTLPSGTYARLKAESEEILSLSWNEEMAFYAWYARFDNGLFDNSFGTNGLQDVSSSVTWTVAPALTASDVGTWRAANRVYQANNTSGASVMDNIGASYQGHTDYRTVSVDTYSAPYLHIVEDGPLTWNCWEYGSGCSKSFQIESNVPWALTGGDSSWYVSSMSGRGDATITVYPKSANTGSDNDITLTVTAISDATLTDSIDLKQDGKEGRGANKLWWSVEISPATKTIAVGETWSRFTATLVSYIDKNRTNAFTRDDISDIAQYEVSDPSVASVKTLQHAPATGEATGLSAGTVTVTGWWLHPDPMTYREGSPVEVPGTATLTVTAETAASLAASPGSLEWTWDESGSGAGKTVTVTATNCTWRVKSIANAFDCSVSGNTLTVYPVAQNASTTADKTGTLIIEGTNGAADISIGLTQAKKTETPPDPASLQVSPESLEWTWDESGSSSGKTVAVTATNCTWEVGSVPDDFGYSVSGQNITVYPMTQNSSMKNDRTGNLILNGSNGAVPVEVSLKQFKKPSPVLTSLSFDKDHYDLVRVVDGTVSTTQSFRVTASYSDGSTNNVTADASYNDQGSVSVSASAGTMTAEAACSGKVVTASYGGLTAQASYSAVDLEIPVGLEGIHFESQEDQNREFVIDSFEATFRRVLSGATRTEEVSVSVDILEGPIVQDPDVDGMLLFHFTSPGSGTVSFTYSAGGISITRYLDVACSEINHISHTWR